jgi:Fe-S-cluster containining protein
MTLTNEDIERIIAQGYKNFFYYVNGYLQLVNVHGHCIFLQRDRCSIYPDRPEGCKLYPLILDIDNNEVILHDFCPYNDEFEFSDEDRERLEALIDIEKKERDERILKRLHDLSK